MVDVENLQVNSSADKFSRGNLYRFGCYILFPLVHIVGKPVTIAEDIRVFFIIREELFHALIITGRAIFTAFRVILRTILLTIGAIFAPDSIIPAG